MRGGTISNNTAGGTIGSRRGGGILLNGTFNMYGGEIYGNTAVNGGGVNYNGWTFNMRGGTIFGNAAGNAGGGVRNYGTFRISNGTIYGNEETVEPHLRNTAGAGAAFSPSTTVAGVQLQLGTFNIAGVFTQLGTIGTTGLTIHVVNGVRQ